jgi:hypothetical protein
MASMGFHVALATADKNQPLTKIHILILHTNPSTGTQGLSNMLACFIV